MFLLPIFSFSRRLASFFKNSSDLPLFFFFSLIPLWPYRSLSSSYTLLLFFSSLIRIFLYASSHLLASGSLLISFLLSTSPSPVAFHGVFPVGPSTIDLSALFFFLRPQPFSVFLLLYLFFPSRTCFIFSQGEKDFCCLATLLLTHLPGVGPLPLLPFPCQWSIALSLKLWAWPKIATFLWWSSPYRRFGRERDGLWLQREWRNKAQVYEIKIFRKIFLPALHKLLCITPLD